MPNDTKEIVILGVKGSGKTVFLSILGHSFESVGEFGFSMRPDPRTLRFVTDHYFMMSPDDGTPQKFPDATDPNKDPLPLTWNVKVGTRSVFRMSSLDCAGETMVRAFTEAGDEEAERRASDALADMFDSNDRNDSSGVDMGVLESIDPVDRLRAMTKRASVVCLFLNPKDFESQIAALPGRFEERLERKIEELRHSKQPDADKKIREAKERKAKALDAARKGLKDRFFATRELLSTFLDNPEFSQKRLVFVLTQTGDEALKAAIEEAGGARGFLWANVHELESYDIDGRTETIAVSSVDNAVVSEDENGQEVSRPDGPIESTGLVDFLVGVGGSCSNELFGLKTRLGALRDAELRFVESVRAEESLEARYAAAFRWNEAAVEWLRETESFLKAQGTSITPTVRKKTVDFVSQDIARARRRFIAERELRRRLFELVAASPEPDVPSAEEMLDQVNAVVEESGFDSFSAEAFGISEDWWNEAAANRIAEFASLQKRFDETIGNLNWKAAIQVLSEMDLSADGEEHAKRESRVCEARRKRTVNDCRTALNARNKDAAEEQLRELAQAEEADNDGPDPNRAELERGLGILKIRLAVDGYFSEFERVCGPLLENGVSGSPSEIRKSVEAMTALLNWAETEIERGKKDFEAELEEETTAVAEARNRIRDVESIVRHRRWMKRIFTVLVLALLGLAYVGIRTWKKQEMEGIRDRAIAFAKTGQYDKARQCIGTLKDVPALLLDRNEFGFTVLPKQWKNLESFGVAKSDAENLRDKLNQAEQTVYSRYGTDANRLANLAVPAWNDYRRAADAALAEMPEVRLNEYGIPPTDRNVPDDTRAFKRASAKFENAFRSFNAATNRMAANVRRYRESRNKALNDLEGLSKRLDAVRGAAEGRGIAGEIGRLSEWTAASNAVARAKLETPRPDHDRFELPALDGPISNLAYQYEKLAGKTFAAAEKSLSSLETTAGAAFKKHDALATLRSVQAGFPGCVDLTDAGWKAAADSLSVEGALGKILDADDPKAAFEMVVGAGKTFSRADWIAARDLLEKLTPADKQPYAEELAFSRNRQIVCESAVKSYEETDRRVRFESAGKEVDALSAAGKWNEAVERWVERNSDKRTGPDEQTLSKQFDSIRAGARKAVHAIFDEPGKVRTDALVTAGLAKKELAGVLSDEIKTIANGRFPAKAPDKVEKADWERLDRTVELIRRAAATIPKDAKNSLRKLPESCEEIESAWGEQWLRDAKGAAETAAKKARSSGNLPDAWTECRKAESFLRNVRGFLDEFDDEGGRMAARVKTVEKTLPCLLCIAAQKDGKPVDVADIQYGGPYKVGIRIPGQPAKVALLSGDFQTMPKVETKAAASKDIRTDFVQFEKRGTQTVTLSFSDADLKTANQSPTWDDDSVWSPPDELDSPATPAPGAMETSSGRNRYEELGWELELERESVY